MALAALGNDRTTEVGEALAQRYERRLAGYGAGATALVRLQRRVLGAERRRLGELHRGGEISDGVFRDLEEELDWAEAALVSRS